MVASGLLILSCSSYSFFLKRLGMWFSKLLVHGGCLRATSAIFFDPIRSQNHHSTHISHLAKSKSTNIFKTSKTKHNSRNKGLNHPIKHTHVLKGLPSIQMQICHSSLSHAKTFACPQANTRESQQGVVHLAFKNITISSS